MKNRNTEGDSWGELLSTFGIEDNTPQNPPQPEETKALPEPVAPDNFGAGPVDAKVENADETSTPKEKKSIFSRFPKINFFGAPPEVSLDSVIEGVKSPSLDGKAFTDNTLEKMPVSQERKDRHKKDRREKVVSQEPDAWSTVASQIDTLATGRDATTKSTRRVASSMFDDPVPESDEVRALKNMMGESPRNDRTRRETSFEEESDFRQRGRRQQREPQSEEREARGRGARYRPPIEVDDLPESDFEIMDDAPLTTREPATRGRGGRGSRFSGDDFRSREPIHREAIHDDIPQEEEWSEVDAALQSGRGARHQRHDNRPKPERRERQPIVREHLDVEDSSLPAYHGEIPSWDEAIGGIISGNIARHRGRANEGRTSGKGHTGRGRR